jgi:peptidyl-prolyl cis-trans isomerase B (cyclophilin B)
MRWKSALVMLVFALVVVGAIVFQDADTGIDPTLRKGKLFPFFQQGTAEEITIQRDGVNPEPSDRVVLARRGTSWRMEQPVDYKANQNEISGLLSSIESAGPAYNTSPLPLVQEDGSKLDLAALGLAKPRAVVTVKSKGQGSTITFMVGKSADTKDNAYLMIKGSDKVYIVAASLIGAVLLPADEYRDKRVFELSRIDVESMAVELPDGRMQFQNKDGIWRMLQPVRDRASKTVVEGLRDRLLAISAEEFGESNISNPADYGFDKPFGRLVISSGKEKQELVLGRICEGSPRQRWAMRYGRPFVFRMNSNEVVDLMTEPERYRDRSLEEFDPTKAISFELQISQVDKKLVIQRSRKNWFIVGAEKVPADNQVLRTTLESLAGTEIKAFISGDGKDLARWGLAEPLLKVKVLLAGGSGRQPDEIIFGNICPAGAVSGYAGRCVYAKRASDPGVFAVDASLVDTLMAGRLNFLGRRVFATGDDSKVSRIKVRKGKILYDAVLKGKVWTLLSPVSEPADTSALRRILERFTDLKASRVVADLQDGAVLKDFGLASPHTTVELTIETPADPVSCSLQMGSSSSSGGMYVRRASGQLIYELPDHIISDIGGELISRNLTRFASDKVKSLSVTIKQKECKLIRTGRGWNIESPAPPGQADGTVVQNFLRRLQRLVALSIADYKPASLSAYGLEKATTVITVVTADGQQHQVLIGHGRNEGRERYIKIPGRSVVFVLPRATVMGLEVSAEDFRVAGSGSAVLKPEKILPQVKLVTSAGEITFELFENDAPNTVANFIELASKGYFDGLLFHRVIKDFMIQGGCPDGTGSGGPGYAFADETHGNPHKVVKYTLCMANRGANTNGSQFFIVTKAACPWLDGKHTVFGRVIAGKKIVDSIGTCRTRTVGNRPGVPVQKQKILRIEILKKRNHEYRVRKL